ncbi:DUF397 domain-containing protein [Micromonospora sp. NPDC049089]|uniref:DUF397 domain-containing protein n=1 Tax=Micromonospora sp. NPDC049089 TaxID=3155496 RepID=UPI0033E2DCAB
MDSQWRKSTRSGSNGACVEVRQVEHAVEVRDSKDCNRQTLRFEAQCWQNFISALER